MLDQKFASALVEYEVIVVQRHLATHGEFQPSSLFPAQQPPVQTMARMGKAMGQFDFRPTALRVHVTSCIIVTSDMNKSILLSFHHL
jgi:hypothetical protein